MMNRMMISNWFCKNYYLQKNYNPYLQSVLLPDIQIIAFLQAKPRHNLFTNTNQMQSQLNEVIY